MTGVNMKKLFLVLLVLAGCGRPAPSPSPAPAPVMAAAYPSIESRVGVTPIAHDGGALGFVCLDTSGSVCSTIASAGNIRSNRTFIWEALGSSANITLVQLDGVDDAIFGNRSDGISTSYFRGYFAAHLQDAFNDTIDLGNSQMSLSPAGTLSITLSTTTAAFSTSMVEGYLGLTIANCNGTPVVLSGAQSANNYLNVVACTAGTTTTEVQSANPPTAGRVLFMRNSATTTTVTFGWSTGGTVSLLTGTSAIITADGTNAIKMTTGT